MRRGRIVLAIVAGLAIAASAGLVVVLAPRQTAAERGQVLVRKFGCEACHGPGGTGGIPNPGSKEREVPAFTGGTAMMYVESEGDLRAWILDGSDGQKKSPAGDEALLEMPPFRGRISDAELDDLVAWYRVVAEWEPEPPAAAAQGRLVAVKFGCFGCHGPGGRIGAANPGALKGYIPGWGSPDFHELVRSEAELREWIREGVCSRLSGNPVAAHFREAALLMMPAYRERLDETQLDALVAYIRWVAPELP